VGSNLELDWKFYQFLKKSLNQNRKDLEFFLKRLKSRPEVLLKSENWPTLVHTLSLTHSSYNLTTIKETIGHHGFFQASN
jgi:hypothetical protein